MPIKITVEEAEELNRNISEGCEELKKAIADMKNAVDELEKTCKDEEFQQLKKTVESLCDYSEKHIDSYNDLGDVCECVAKALK